MSRIILALVFAAFTAVVIAEEGFKNKIIDVAPFARDGENVQGRNFYDGDNRRGYGAFNSYRGYGASVGQGSNYGNNKASSVGYGSNYGNNKAYPSITKVVSHGYGLGGYQGGQHHAGYNGGYSTGFNTGYNTGYKGINAGYGGFGYFG